MGAWTPNPHLPSSSHHHHLASQSCGRGWVLEETPFLAKERRKPAPPSPLDPKIRSFSQLLLELSWLGQN